MTKLIVILLLLCAHISFSFADTASFVQCLSTKLPQDIIYLPNNVKYTTVLQAYIKNGRFNTSTTPKPTVIITPQQESQAQVTVSCAKLSGVQLKIRSGGHDYEGLSYVSSITPFAVLDMFNLRSIDINLSDETAWVQAGATLGELYYNIWQKSNVHAFPGGVCPTVCVGGHFSGGGYGNMVRKYGLTVDNIVDARVIDAKGRILDRKGMGEDLFWAIRGGGGASFGVILAYRIKLVPVPSTVTVFKIIKTMEENATDLVHRWQYIAHEMDNDLFMRISLKGVPGTKPTGKAIFFAMFLGEAKRLLSVMDTKFPELGVTAQDCKEMTWINSTLFWADFKEGTPPTELLTRKNNTQDPGKMKSDYIKTPMPRYALEGLLKRMVEAGHIMMQWNAYGGRMSEIPETAVPFPHRAGNIFKIQYLISWKNTSQDETDSNINKIRKMYNYMTPFVTKNPREAFLNYRDIDIGSLNNSSSGIDAYNEAKVYGVKYFRGNFDRLVKVKTMVDPDNFFRNEQGIPPLKSL